MFCLSSSVFFSLYRSLSSFTTGLLPHGPVFFFVFVLHFAKMTFRRKKYNVIGEQWSRETERFLGLPTNTLARGVPYINAAHRGRVWGDSVLLGSAARSIKRVGEESFEELETPYLSSYAAIGPP